MVKIEFPMLNMRILPLYIALLLCAATAQAQVFDQPRYATYRNWALAPPWKEHGYKIVSFIPESYLLYLSDAEPVTVSNQQYTLALTQDGVEVLVHPRSISELSFQQSVGDHQVIFNSDFLLCKTRGCTAALANDWLVARGEAYKITAEEGNTITLLGTRGSQTLTGYIQRTDLDHLERIGKITRTDRMHPRYNIEKRQSGVLATSCGETKAVGDLIDLPNNDTTVEGILSLLSVAQINRCMAGDMTEQPLEEDAEQSAPASLDQVEIVSAYGGEGYRNTFYLYEVEDLSQSLESDERFFDVAVALKIDYSLEEGGGIRENYIEHMTLMNSKNVFNGRPIANEISMDYFNTPLDLQEYTGDAYMISINKLEHFERALEILSNRIGDPELSGYMLTELNRSCRSEMRNPYSQSKCITYDY
jgi:hypothetical protein